MLPLPAWHPWGVQVGLAAAEGLVAKGWCHAPGHLEDHSTLGGGKPSCQRVGGKGLVPRTGAFRRSQHPGGASLAAKGLHGGKGLRCTGLSWHAKGNSHHMSFLHGPRPMCCLKATKHTTQKLAHVESCVRQCTHGL